VAAFYRYFIQSAAASYGNHVIGIILTGYLNDGASGMVAIKRSGGTCIVQDPNQAEYPDMPLAVLDSMEVEVDYCISLSEMGNTIKEIISKDDGKKLEVPADMVKEAEIAEKAVVSIDTVESLGNKVQVVCPDCGGNLWEMENDPIKRYCCHVGHAYTESDLLLKQSDNLEATLWVAMRMMEERRGLLRKIGLTESNRGLTRMGEEHQKRAEELEIHIKKLKELFFKVQKD